MSKLIEVYAIEMKEAVNEETKKVLISHGCRYANVKKLYRLEEEEA